MIQTLGSEHFTQQIRRAFVMSIINWLTFRPRHLLNYNDVIRNLPFCGQRDEGVEAVPVDNIVGTVGRTGDFDAAFRPLHPKEEARWVSIYRAFFADIILPPVELYRVGETYFVVDGHHRVSVARANGQRYLDAHIIEIDVSCNRA